MVTTDALAAVRVAFLALRPASSVLPGNLDVSCDGEEDRAVAVPDVSVQGQQAFLTDVLDACPSGYPAPRAVRRSYLRRFMALVTEANAELDDDLYAAYQAELYGEQVEQDVLQSGYMTLVLAPATRVSEQRHVTLRVSTAMFPVGMCAWPAAYYLAQYLAHPDQQASLAGRRVLELGAGVGLTALVLQRVLPAPVAPAGYTVTDYTAGVMDNLRGNLALFRRQAGAAAAQGISAAAMDWDDDEQVLHVLQDAAPQVVLAADVVYDPCAIPSLCKVIARAVCDHHAVAYVASTIRNPTTHQAFRTALEANAALQVVQIVMPPLLSLFPAQCLDPDSVVLLRVSSRGGEAVLS